MSQKQYTIGGIAGVHGIKGDLKVFPLTDEINRFEKLKKLNVETSKGTTEYEIERVWYHKKFVMLKLKNVDSVDEALMLKGAQIKIDEAFALPLGEDEYFIGDLYDMEVFTEEGERLGKITDVLESAANDVYEVESNLYIPAIKQCIMKVDVSSKKMIVRLMEGLK